jgi:hypothetical protein
VAGVIASCVFEVDRQSEGWQAMDDHRGRWRSSDPLACAQVNVRKATLANPP